MSFEVWQIASAWVRNSLALRAFDPSPPPPQPAASTIAPAAQSPASDRRLTSGIGSLQW